MDRIVRDPAAADDVRRLARVLDAAVRIPGTNFRVGLDALIGLVPGVGDAVGAALSGWIVLAAARMGLPKSVIARMLVNLGIDTVVGAVPILGDLFDMAFRANTRNVALIESALSEPVATRKRSRAIVAGIVVALLVLLALAIAAAVLLVRALAAAF
jgi:hypothetical protein